MKIIENATFLSWAGKQALKLDARYESPRTLSYPPESMIHDDELILICADSNVEESLRSKTEE